MSFKAQLNQAGNDLKKIIAQSGVEEIDVSVPAETPYVPPAVDRQAILTKAIEKAIEGGWYGIYKDGHTWPEAKKILEWQWEDGPQRFTDGAYENTTTLNVEAVIFNHDFAKALFGDAATDRHGNHMSVPMFAAVHGCIPAWQYHLQSMVISEDPIAYLAENMD